MFKRYLTIQAVCTALALGGLLAGCGGVNQQPLAPERAATLQKADESAYSNDNPFTLVFAPKGFDLSKARVRAAKPTVVREATGLFSPRRYGRLEVRFNPGDGDDDDDDRGGNSGVRAQRATFEVKKGAIDREVEISMSVFSGSALTDIGVKFTPSGLKFHPPARLEIVLQGDVNKKDLQGLKAYHIEGGKVTEISIKVTGNKNNLTLTLEIPGFSIYSIGDELIPEAGP